MMSYYFYHSAKKAIVGTIGAVIFHVLSATSVQCATVTLSWDANPESDLAGYRLHYGTASRVYTQMIDVGNSTTAAVSGLSEGTLYFFAVTASNTAGIASAFSSEVAYAPPSQTPPPITPTPPPVSISGAVAYCVDPMAAAVPNVTLTLTGSGGGSALSAGSGSYQFSSLVAGGNYTVTPTKNALPTGTGNINTVDVVGSQRHFLNRAPLPPGCAVTAADVNGDTAINTVDVIAIQRFFLGLTTGLANVGKYRFSPASRTYSGIVGTQTGQNYDALVFGDVAGPFAERPEESQLPASSGVVSEVALPQVAVQQFVTNFSTEVTATFINARDNLVGFQGDFTFDERVVSFQDEPVSNAGLTAGNWNVSANVLPGRGPMRTLRISAYSSDLTPLSGSGTLFSLNMIRVDTTPGASTDLTWVAAGLDQFIFIDADLNMQAPENAVPGTVTLEPAP